MGIYDREYIRGESSGTSLFGGVTPVTKSIIVTAVVVFFVENLLSWRPQGITAAWLAASPEQTFHHFRLFQLVTAPFLSHTIWGLFFDMYFLWFMGRELETLYGSRDFLVFYLAAAVLTTLSGLAVAASAGHSDAMIIGPWGTIIAVMTLFTLYYPKREILVFMIIPTPIWVLLSIYILVPLLWHFSQVSPSVDLGVVLSGAGFAYAYKQLDLRWSRLISGRRFRPRLRIFSSSDYDQSRPRGRNPSRTSASVGGGRAPGVSVLPEEQLDARLDEILAKIARDGNRDSLTEEEQRVLEEASRRARIRRSDRV
jgi:membrane associated rhomboid family serine protease